MEYKRGKQDFSNKVIVFIATSDLIFQYKNVRETSFNKYSIITTKYSFQLLKGKSTKEIANMLPSRIKTV